MLLNHLLDKCDAEAVFEKEDKNTLTNYVKQELNDLDGVSSTKAIGMKLANWWKKL